MTRPVDDPIQRTFFLNKPIAVGCKMVEKCYKFVFKKVGFNEYFREDCAQEVLNEGAEIEFYMIRHFEKRAHF